MSKCLNLDLEFVIYFGFSTLDFEIDDCHLTSTIFIWECSPLTTRISLFLTLK
jgi:hypothetical protein